MEKDEKTISENSVPIIDGDARPDMGVEKDPATKSKPVLVKNEKEKFTKSRTGDTDSIEDYKDAKS
jgi:hypothetical protein